MIDGFLKDNGISKVWLEDGYVFKRQPLFLTDNEIWCLEQMDPSGYVPKASRIDLDIIRLEYIKTEEVTDGQAFKWHCYWMLKALKAAGIRHGDITDANLLVRDNKPYLIDFSESRLMLDPRPDKRPEGDEYWLNKTMEKLCGI